MRKLYLILFSFALNYLYAQVPGEQCAAGKLAGAQRSYANVVDSSQIAMEKLYDNHFVKIAIEVHTNTLAINANTTIMASAVQPMDTFALELDYGYTIDSIFENGQPDSNYIRFGTDNNDLDIILSKTYQPGDQVTLQIFYHGTRQTGGSETGWYGISASSDIYTGTNDRCIFTLSDPYAARQWWPAKQALYDKFDSTEVDITTDSFNKAGSNGLLVSVDSVNAGPGMVTYVWKNNYPIAYYLIFLSAGTYLEHDYYAHPPVFLPGGNSVFVQNYVFADPDSATFKGAIPQLDSVGLFLDSFSVRYGPYPYPLSKFGEIFSPFGGGMEDQTMTDICCLITSDLAHELTHQWFGDLVTNESYQDTWLNEGFAVYGEYLYREIFSKDQRASYMETLHQSAMSVPNGSVYVMDTANFDSIFNLTLTYHKGASVINMMRYVVDNDSLYFASLRNYLGRHQFGVTITDSLMSAMEQNTGISFHDFFDQWIYGQGYPTFNVSWNWRDDTLYVSDSETVTEPDVTPVFTIPVEYTVRRNGGDTTFKLMQSANVNHFTIPLADSVLSFAVDTFGYLLALNVVTNDPSLYFVDSTTGIANINEPAIELFPNPVSDYLWVRVSGLPGSMQAEIFNMDGQLLQANTIANGNNLFNISALAGGIYLIKLTNSAESKTLRFVKE